MLTRYRNRRSLSLPLEREAEATASACMHTRRTHDRIWKIDIGTEIKVNLSQSRQRERERGNRVFLLHFEAGYTRLERTGSEVWATSRSLGAGSAFLIGSGVVLETGQAWEH